MTFIPEIQVGKTPAPKIAQFQAMEALGLSGEDYCHLLRETWAATYEGTPWLKRPKIRQKQALATVLNKVYSLQICGQYLGSNCADERRKILVEFCLKAGESLVESGWSWSEVMEWLTEIKEQSKI